MQRNRWTARIFRPTLGRNGPHRKTRLRFLCNEKRYSVPLYTDDLLPLVSLDYALDYEIQVNESKTAWVSSLAEGDTETVHGFIRNDLKLRILDLENRTRVSP